MTAANAARRDGSESSGERLFGFDEHGEVRDLGHVVHRKIRDDYKPMVAKLHRTYLDAGLAGKGIVETTLRADGDLEHRKLITSYSYEWPANMYKDAVLFHLGLFAELEAAGLTLKDALPNNIVFDHTRPVFVDFLSLVAPQALRELPWLDAGAYAEPRFAVTDRMLLPYMVLPLLFMASRRHATARDLLSTRSCNCDGTPPSWRELLRPPLRRGFGWLPAYLHTLWVAADLLPVRSWSKKRDAVAFGRLIGALSRRLGDLNVTPPPSAYSSYYDEKQEATSLADPGAFLPKQRTVFETLRARAPASVLDLGANTGWFSVLAAQAGASVIALEADEACADILYRRAKAQGLRILSLKSSFGDLTREIRGVGGGLLYRAGVERLGADLVLVLGLIHHLVLGEGSAIGDVLALLARLARKTLVLEFVSLDDDKIRGDPGFFPNLLRFDPSSYNLDLVAQAGLRHFSRVEVRPSHPDTRAILVFDR